MKTQQSLLLFVTLLFGQSEMAHAKIDSLNSWTHAYFNTSVSINDQFNIRFSTPIEYVKIPYSLESSFLSTSIVKNKTNRFFVSSNSLLLFGAVAIGGILSRIGKVGQYPGAVIGIGAIATQMLTNFKVGYAPTRNIAFVVAQNTDYYILFYEEPKIYTESAVGIKLSNKHMRATVDICFPWTEGYFYNKEPHINLGFSYFMEFPSRMY